MITSDWIASIAAFIAFLAFIRPEITNFFLYRRGTIEFHPRDRVIVGFTAFGPRFSVDGTMESISRSHFIDSITLKIVRLRDNSEHEFIWDLWESPVVGKWSGHAIPAYPFPLIKDTNLQGLLTFGDESTKARFYDNLLALGNAFTNFITANYPNADASFDRVAAFQAHNLYEQQLPPAQLRMQSGTYDLLRRIFYWDEGTYYAEMSIKTSRPKKIFKFSFNFALTHEESDRLRDNNVINALWNACGIQNVPYQQAQPKITNFKRINS